MATSGGLIIGVKYLPPIPLNEEIVKVENLIKGGEVTEEFLAAQEDLKPLLNELNKKWQTEQQQEYQAGDPGVTNQGGGFWPSLGQKIKAQTWDKIKGQNKADTTPTDDQQSALIPSLLELNNSKLDIMNDQLTKLTSATGAAGLMTARAIDKNATFRGIEERIT